MADDWKGIQKKTFTRWCNTYLKERMLKVDDLQTELSDGLKLIQLLEIISGKSLGRHNKKPKIPSHFMENLNICLKFLRDEGIKLVNIGAEDINKQDIKLILGLIWTIILRYQINMGEGKGARSELLKWVRSKIPEYNIMNFSADWNDGKALCALGNALQPGTCPEHRSLDESDALNNAQKGLDNGLENFEIPKIIDANDLINPHIDELSVMTYISYYRDWEVNKQSEEAKLKIERTAVPQNCRAYGPGLEQPLQGEETEFTIEAINTHDRRCPIGGEKFDVKISGPSEATVSFNYVDNENGTYTVTYQPKEYGDHKVSIQLRDTHIKSSVFTVPVIRAGPDPSQTLVYGDGLEKAMVGKPAQFKIESRNKLGNPVGKGGDPFVIAIKGPEDTEVEAQLKDNQDGTYDVTYTPVTVGPHEIAVTLEDAHVAKSPYTAKAEENPENPSAENTIAYGPGLENGKCNTAEPAEFTIETKNHLGDRVPTAGDCLKAFVEDPTGAELPVDIKDNGDGTYKASYQPLNEGKHKVNVLLKDPYNPLLSNHIKDSPKEVDIEAGAFPGTCEAFGPGIEDNKTKDTEEAVFTIQAKDRHGNPLKKGGEKFDVDIEGPTGKIDPEITDNNDGTYTVKYQPKKAGPHKVEVKNKDQHIKDSPFKFNIAEGVDAGLSKVGTMSFTIVARNKDKQPKVGGGDKFEVQIFEPDKWMGLKSGPKIPDEETKLNITDDGQGVYTVTYKVPKKYKKVKIRVLIDDKEIKGSPWIQQADFGQ